jgi:hypothetical protein
MAKDFRRLGESLPENPLKRYNSYRVFYTIKLSRAYSDPLAPDGSRIADTSSGPPSDARLLMDTRGEGAGRTVREGNLFPKFSVRSFDTLFDIPQGTIAVTPNVESTLVLYERGGCSYLQELGKAMIDLRSTSTGEIIYWVGVGIYGWVGEDAAARNLHPEQISMKWFPTKIRKIDMEMKDSGSTYNHWLDGMAYFATNNLQYTQINTVTTMGETLGDHLQNLTSIANEEIQEVKKRSNENIDTEETPPGSGEMKNIIFDGFFFEKSYGVTINKNALIKTNSSAKTRGGIPTVSSGGGKGHTTIDAHVQELLKHCPEVTNYLKDQGCRHYILPRMSITPEEDIVAYVIKPVITDPEKRKFLPMRRYNYFFGGRNEDIVKFDLQFEGLDRVLPMPHVDTSTSRTAPNPEQVDDAVANYKRTSEAETVSEKSVGGAAARNPSDSSSITQNNYGTLNKRAKLGRGFTPFIPTREEFGTTQTDEAAKAYKDWMNRTILHVGQQFLAGGFTIQGDPNLIWDPGFVKQMRSRNIDIEALDNYITFSIGTPNEDFPDIPDIDRFIFSGGYQIKRIKSMFNADGSFTQQISVDFKPDTGQTGGSTAKIPQQGSDINDSGSF